MEQRKKRIEHTDVSRSEQLLQYNEEIGRAIVNAVSGYHRSEVEDMTLLENSPKQTNSDSHENSVLHTGLGWFKKRTWKSGDKITASTQFDIDRVYTLEEYDEIVEKFLQNSDMRIPNIRGMLRW